MAGLVNTPLLISSLASQLWRATLNGTARGTEGVMAMHDVRLGDIVFVWLTGRDVDPLTEVGIYDTCWSHLEEYDDLSNQWSGDLVYGIQLLDGTYFKWTNVELLSLSSILGRDKQWQD